MDFQMERELVIITQQALLCTPPELCRCSLFARTEAAGVQGNLSNQGVQPTPYSVSYAPASGSR
jgi:hypothetical protein